MFEALQKTAAEQKNSLHQMSFKSLAQSFNTAANIMMTVDESLKEVDPTRTAVALNALAFYQAHVGLAIIARYPHRVGSMVERKLRDKNEMTVTPIDGSWVPATAKVTADMDQQKAHVAEAISDLTTFEHSRLMQTALDAFNRFCRLYEESDGPVHDVVLCDFENREVLDDIAFLVLMAAVQLNDEFERKWPELMPK